jgi:hypothetical protein
MPLVRIDLGKNTSPTMRSEHQGRRGLIATTGREERSTLGSKRFELLAGSVSRLQSSVDAEMGR